MVDGVTQYQLLWGKHAVCSYIKKNKQTKEMSPKVLEARAPLAPY